MRKLPEEYAMIMKRYQFALFSPQGKLVLSFNLPGWTLLIVPLLLAGLSSTNVFLHDYYASHRDSLSMLAEMDAQQRELNEQLLESTHDLTEIENALASITDFNAKMRIMLNMSDGADQDVLIHHPRAQRGLRHLPALYGNNMTRQLRGKVNTLGEAMLHEEIRQQDIARSISKQLERLATIPVIMPTRGRFSSPFGWRKDPFKGTRRFHKGIDITARTGTPIRAAANGFVTQVTRSPSYGLVIMLTHSEDVKTRYAHMSKFAVEEGQRVLRGQVIGYVGNTGRSKAPHLHYEVHVKGRPVNPRNYILQ